MQFTVTADERTDESTEPVAPGTCCVCQDIGSIGVACCTNCGL